MIRELKEELALLRSKLGGGGGGRPAAPGEEVYAEGTPWSSRSFLSRRQTAPSRRFPRRKLPSS